MTHTSSHTPRRRPRAVSLVLFAVLAIGSTLIALVVDRVVDDQEHRLLDQQAQAAGAVVSSAFGANLSTLPLLGTLSQPGFGGPALFTAAVQPMVAGGGSVDVLRKEGDTFVVENAVGTAATVGTPVDARIAALAARATGAKGAVFDVTNGTSGARKMMLAVPSVASADVVVYAEFVFDDSMLQAGPDTPFSELDGALYIGRRADPSNVLLATTKLPVSGSPVVHRTVTVGADTWLLVVTPKKSLVGALAKRLPVLVFGAGLVAALLATALVELASRRRAYALRLVDERTHDLRVAREAAEAANRSKNEFLSRMSHELRTPLNAVLGFAQLLESDDLPPEQHDSVRQILHGGRHLLNLINEVLEISRIETGTFSLSPEPVNVADMVDEVIELTQPLAARASIQLARDGGGFDVHVLADRQRFKQILLNLVGNAVKYNRQGGSVTLTCSSDNAACVRVNVHDTGLGIRDEHLSLLFTPFERLGAERTTIEGTGVGLALSRRLAEAMGGTIDVDSTFGQGSTFWVEMPAAERPADRDELMGDVTPALATTANGTDRRTILYIEDNLANIQLVEQVFATRTDIEVLSVTKGRLGLELAREHQPALVLLDLHLPDLTGADVLRQLREHEQTSAIPVVMISADATPEQVQRLLTDGARAYLTKPVDVAELRRLVDDLLQPV